MCYLCPRTTVTHLPGLYREKGQETRHHQVSIDVNPLIPNSYPTRPTVDTRGRAVFKYSLSSGRRPAQNQATTLKRRQQ